MGGFEAQSIVMLGDSLRMVIQLAVPGMFLRLVEGMTRARVLSGQRQGLRRGS